MPGNVRRLLVALALPLAGCGGDCESLHALAGRVAVGAVDCGTGSDLPGAEAPLAAANACVDAAAARGGRFAVRYRILGIDSALHLVLQHEADGALHRYWVDAAPFDGSRTVDRGLCAGAATARSFSRGAVRDCTPQAQSMSVCD